MTEITQITRRKVPLGSSLFLDILPLTPEEIARRKAEKVQRAMNSTV
jgi:hypothetical protein